MSKNIRSKYFIAIIPPEPVYSMALDWKNFFAEKFNSKAALRSPPHITLHMPFEMPRSKENSLVRSLEEFARNQNVFDIELNGFAGFPPKVIYINVVDNVLLSQLQKKLSGFCKNTLGLLNSTRKGLPFHAHLTVAFRDLKKILFPGAMNTVSDERFNFLFCVRDIALLKHNGITWDIFQRISFGSQLTS